MSRFVSPNKERGYVNYDELVKFFDRCVHIDSNANTQQMYNNSQYNDQYVDQQSMMNQQQMMPQNISGFLKQPTYGPDGKLQYDPDEQAILRLMHENMREWDQVNLIDCDNLRRKFYEVDRNNRYTLSQSEVIYKDDRLKLIFASKNCLYFRLKMFAIEIVFQFSGL